MFTSRKLSVLSSPQSQSVPESSTSLLVHLCPWRHPVHSHEEDLPWLDDPEEHLQVMEDVSKYLFLRDAKVDILIIRVRALVDDAVHVQIEIVKLWNLRGDRKLYKMHKNKKDIPPCLSSVKNVSFFLNS